MMKRLITLIVGFIFVCTTCWSNEEYDITLEKGIHQGKMVELPFGNLWFKLVEYGNNLWVDVSIDNTTMDQALLLFRNHQNEKGLKKNKPKIEFEKTYPGSKGYRSVFGCKGLKQSFLSVVPGGKTELFSQNVSTTAVTKLEIPLYLAKYNPKQLTKKGAYKINYKILREEIPTIIIKVKGWSENDPDYVSVKKAVEDYARSVENASFCRNRKHTPSLAEQQRPFIAKRDSLVDVITTTLQNHNDWLSVDEPHRKYSELLDQLNKVNLNERTGDCGEHKSGGRKNKLPEQHSCSYCPLSLQQIYHQLDDLYQQLRNGKISKEAAVKKAEGLYTCFQKNTKRKKDDSYSVKISRFYSRITGY